MTQIDDLRQDLTGIEAEIADSERAAATATGDTLAQLGGTLAGLAAKARAIGAALATALGIEAAREKAHAAAAVEAEKQAVLARAVALEARWQAFLADVEATDTHAGALWADCRAMTAEYNTVNRTAAELGMPLFGADVLGMQGTPTLANAKNLQGNLYYHA